ncbi:MAG: hypothetical protein H6584_06140 [Flavobacteriales bacterium]|nr:hypothetical protein [Flavobacteriales bacterium]
MSNSLGEALARSGGSNDSLNRLHFFLFIRNFQLKEKSNFRASMGALKLTYRYEESTLKVVSRKTVFDEKSSAGIYRLGFNGTDFLLQTKQTDCLAKDNCGVPQEKPKIRLSTLQTAQSSRCAPNSGCC